MDEPDEPTKLALVAATLLSGSGTLTAEAIGGAAKACLSCVGLISLFAMGACNDPKDNGLPGAQTPLNLSVEVPFVNAAGSQVWATVNPTASLGGTSYIVLPLIAPKVQVFFSAPYPSTFHMAASMLVGVPTTAPNSGAAMAQNVDLPEYSGNQEGPATGYFQLLGVNPAPSPPQWNYLVRIPDSFMTSRSIDIRITNVSENPIYTSGPSQESYPLMFTLTDSATDVSVTVSIVGETGENLVTSDPPGINCRPTCSVTFRGWSTVRLTPNYNPPINYHFSEWSGDCTGNAPCTLQLDGHQKSVTAFFLPQ